MNPFDFDTTEFTAVWPLQLSTLADTQYGLQAEGEVVLANSSFKVILSEFSYGDGPIFCAYKAWESNLQIWFQEAILGRKLSYGERGELFEAHKGQIAHLVTVRDWDGSTVKWPSSNPGWTKAASQAAFALYCLLSGKDRAVCFAEARAWACRVGNRGTGKPASQADPTSPGSTERVRNRLRAEEPEVEQVEVDLLRQALGGLPDEG